MHSSDSVSGLNSYLHRINVVESTTCSCSSPNETIFHYFLECPIYKKPRSDLLRKICNILAPGVNPSLVVHAAGDILITYITHGNGNISLEENVEIVDAVHKFIFETRRFLY